MGGVCQVFLGRKDTVSASAGLLGGVERLVGGLCYVAGGAVWGVLTYAYTD